jgi:membrane-bound serine protease (ClpP class)
MAPGTSIGAASPIDASGGGTRDEEGRREDVGAEKAEKFTTAFIEAIAKQRKRNVEWAAKAVREAEAVTQEEALELGVIDLVASDNAELLRKADGRKVEVAGETRTLELAGAEQRRIEMSPVTRLFDFLADPNVVMLLVSAGMLLLFVEFNTPGAIAPGVAGALCLLLAGVGFQILPFSWVGLLMLLAGIGFVMAELFVTSHGVLMAAGLVCMLLGGSMVFDMPETSDLTVSFWSVLVPVVGAFGVFALVVVFAVGGTLRMRQTAGVDELIGSTGKTVGDLDPAGKVFIRGEYWSAVASEKIPRGSRVEVIAVEGLQLRVRRAPGTT